MRLELEDLHAGGLTRLLGPANCLQKFFVLLFNDFRSQMYLGVGANSGVYGFIAAGKLSSFGRFVDLGEQSFGFHMFGYRKALKPKRNLGVLETISFGESTICFGEGLEASSV